MSTFLTRGGGRSCCCQCPHFDCAVVGSSGKVGPRGGETDVCDVPTRCGGGGGGGERGRGRERGGGGEGRGGGERGRGEKGRRGKGRRGRGREEGGEGEEGEKGKERVCVEGQRVGRGWREGVEG